ncbi:MAG: hypothetical protein ABFS16_07700 [Bacteroidota bacterium]
MKNYINKILALFIVFTLAQSCEIENNTIDDVFENVQRGAILRTLSFSNTYNFYDVDNTTYMFNVEVEEQDSENGNLVSKIQLYQSFVDNTDDGVDNNKDEVLVSTFTPNDLSASENGLPLLNLSMKLSEALTASGLSEGEYSGGDQFIYRFELILTDGQSFTSTNASGTVTGGSFFSSPFAYAVTIKCLPVTPFAGDYTLIFTDSWGDGWDGAFMTVVIDGVSTDYTCTGSESTHVVNVPEGTTELEFSYTKGMFEEEHSYIIVGPFGDDAASDGPGPNDGIILLNICN